LSQQKKTEAVDSELIRRLYYFFKPYRWWAVFAIVLTLTAAFLGTVRPKLTQVAVDDHIAIGDIDGLSGLFSCLALHCSVSLLCLILNTYITRWFGQGVLFSLQKFCF
jgi:ATP-binding cassette, subfamily B, multidrug efflux pump